jgi:putative transcriptional regulator
MPALYYFKVVEWVETHGDSGASPAANSQDKTCADMSDVNLTGYFLVASRYLRDPNFARSVVLMIHHNEDGAMGLVINRPSGKTVRDVWELIDNDPCDREDFIFIGGPVPSNPLALHSVEEFSQAEVLPGLHVASDMDALDVLARKKDISFRLYSGHAGWGSGQLEGEMEAGGWLFTRATVDDVFADHETIWKTVTQRIGLEIMAPQLDAEHVPSDPSLN